MYMVIEIYASSDLKAVGEDCICFVFTKVIKMLLSPDSLPNHDES